jgi:hypothetical protein
MRWERMDEWLAEKDDRIKYITERNENGKESSHSAHANE